MFGSIFIKKTIGFAICFLGFGFIVHYTCTTASAATGKLDDITIIGNFEQNIETHKPLIKLKDFNFNIQKKIMIRIDTKNILSNLEVENIFSTKEDLIPRVVSSKRTIKPYFHQIKKEPIMIFRLSDKFDYSGIHIHRWRLKIVDPQQILFKQFSGKRKIPKKIYWNGKNKKGEMIRPGKYYSYILEIEDRSRKKHTFAGETFHYKAIFYEEKKYGMKIISISLDKLFGKKRKNTHIVRGNKLLLQEIGDLLKRYYNKHFRIIIYDKNSTIAIKRGNSLSKYLRRTLLFNDKTFDVSVDSVYIAKHSIDIVISD